MTVQVGLSRSFTVILGDTTPEEFDAETDRIMDALLDLEGDVISNSAVGVNLKDCVVDIDVLAIGETFDDAVAAADAAIRAAIHAAGGGTPGWEPTARTKHAELVTA